MHGTCSETRELVITIYETWDGVEFCSADSIYFGALGETLKWDLKKKFK
jgi:hypothetical protein